MHLMTHFLWLSHDVYYYVFRMRTVARVSLFSNFNHISMSSVTQKFSRLHHKEQQLTFKRFVRRPRKKIDTQRWNDWCNEYCFRKKTSLKLPPLADKNLIKKLWKMYFYFFHRWQWYHFISKAFFGIIFVAFCTVRLCNFMISHNIITINLPSR